MGNTDRHFYDSCFDVWFGDELTGFVAHGQVKTWREVETWLDAAARQHYPDSAFAKG